MKKTIQFVGVFMLGVFSSLTIVNASPEWSDFRITVRAAGQVKLQCHKGCAWSDLSWTCNDNDPSQQCSVPIDQMGMAK